MGYDQSLVQRISSLKAQEFDKGFLERVQKAIEKDEVYRKDLKNDSENKTGLILFQKRLRIPQENEKHSKKYKASTKYWQHTVMTIVVTDR